MFGGVSAEHEVSIITGLQVLENIDRVEYEPHAIYVTKKGEFSYLGQIKNRKQFKQDIIQLVTFGKDKKGGFVQTSEILSRKIYPYTVYLAFHGGLGESGNIQGMLDCFSIPYTSSSLQSSAITMNKSLTKKVVTEYGVSTVPGVSYFSHDIRNKSGEIAKEVIQKLHLPVIIKPVHLGSSIGIKIAKTQVELEKALLECAFIDSEILVEKLLVDFVEFNCSVRLINGKLETSEIEKPFSKDEILSFADKYERGGKKVGGDAGMASLQRELPAKIDRELKNLIQDTAKQAFVACCCKGMVRIDFMYSADKKLYLTEINPIPGSVAFYLWEAAGITFKNQITDLVEQSVKDFHETAGMQLDYKSGIVNKFVNS